MRDGSGVGEIFRDQWPRLVSVLVRDFHDVELAEEAAQEAFLEAAARWGVDGMPRSPEGWLVTTARRKAIDRLRRSKILDRHLATLAETLGEQRAANGAGGGDGAGQAWPAGGLSDAAHDQDWSSELIDEQLVLLLGCCHPALSHEAQVALTLRIVGGLSTEQIAGAFLVSGSTMGRRLGRAKTKIRRPRFRSPCPIKPRWWTAWPRSAGWCT